MKARRTTARTVAADTVRYRSKLRPIIVSLFPNGMIALRLLGTRYSVEVDPRTVYDLGVKMRVSAERAERRAQRKSK